MLHDRHSLPGFLTGAAGAALVALSGVRARPPLSPPWPPGPPRCCASGRFRYTAQVTCLLVSGTVAVAPLVPGPAPDPPEEAVPAVARGTGSTADVRTLWLPASPAAPAAVPGAAPAQW